MTHHGKSKEELIAEIERLRSFVTDLADEMEMELQARFAGTLDYPSQKRRYDCEMTTVHEARAFISGQKDQPQ